MAAYSARYCSSRLSNRKKLSKFYGIAQHTRSNIDVALCGGDVRVRNQLLQYTHGDAAFCQVCDE